MGRVLRSRKRCWQRTAKVIYPLSPLSPAIAYNIYPTSSSSLHSKLISVESKSKSAARNQVKMAQYNNDRYADPYQQQQNQYANYDQQPYGYSNDQPHAVGYGHEAPAYSTPDVHTLSHTTQQQPDEYYASTDKIHENSAMPAGADDYDNYTNTVPVERERKGRQGAGASGASKSWAQGPPPRSTGILRMWRKDERGKQWTRVSTNEFLRGLTICDREPS